MLPEPILTTRTPEPIWRCYECGCPDAWVDMPDDTVVCSDCFTTHTMPAGWYEQEED
jgi:hypothetical protein